MNLKVSPRKNGRKYLYIEKAYRDPVTKTNKAKTIKSLGYLDVLEKEHNDPIAYFKGIIKEMTDEENQKKHITLALSMSEELPHETDNRKNLGYAALMKIYHDLLIHSFLSVKEQRKGFEYNTNSIMLLLVISRILSPGSKKKAFEDRKRYFERFNFSLADIYRALTHLASIEKDMQRYIHEQINRLYGRDTSVVYFDATNFYFEIDAENDLRRKGVSKEHRPNPIVQMGLAMDRDGIPIAYKLFPGNIHDDEAFRGVIGEVCRHYNTGRIVVVGDMGIITGNNIWYLIGGNPYKPLHGYVFSFSVRGGTDDFKKYVLSENGYMGKDGAPLKEGYEFKMKSRRMAREINVLMTDGKMHKKTVYEKQVIFWSKKYADKAKADRERVLTKTAAMVSEPSKYNHSANHGAAKYIREVDKKSGEIEPDMLLQINTDKIAEEELYDGYYAIVTSEIEMKSRDIIDTYRGLWEIEELFRISKGELEARPIFVSRDDHINAHFLICFVSLVIIKLLKKATGARFSSECLIDALNRISCSLFHDNLFVFDYRTPVTDAICDALHIDFSKKYLPLGDIKNFLSAVKKPSVPI